MFQHAVLACRGGHVRFSKRFAGVGMGENWKSELQKSHQAKRVAAGAKARVRRSTTMRVNTVSLWVCLGLSGIYEVVLKMVTCAWVARLGMERN